MRAFAAIFTPGAKNTLGSISVSWPDLRIISKNNGFRAESS